MSLANCGASTSTMSSSLAWARPAFSAEYRALSAACTRSMGEQRARRSSEKQVVGRRWRPALAVVVVAGDADAHSDEPCRQRCFVRDAERLDCVEDAVEQVLSAGTRRLRQQHDKLLAAIARDQICRAQAGAHQGLRHGPQAGIACRMAIAVVEQLEVVDINHQQRQRVAGPPGAVPFPLQRLVEAPPVGDVGSGRRWWRCGETRRPCA